VTNTDDLPTPAPDQPATDFLSLFLADQRRIYCYLVTLLASTEDAEDLLQETAKVLWTKFGEYRPGTSFFSWACQTAQYLVLNHRRRKDRHVLMLDDDVLDQLAQVPPEEAEALGVRRSILLGCLDKLSTNDRSLFERRYAASTKGKDLAAESGRPAESIYRSLARIRRLLVECVRRALAIAEREGESS
jgi:RNA polymerase sigma-70 factor (ECF subfamily)